MRQLQLLVHERDVKEGATSNFLLIIELKRLDQESLPSSLRTLMTTRTYLEWPGGHDLDGSAHCKCVNNFWRRLKEGLGPPHVRPEEDKEDATSEEELLEGEEEEDDGNP